MFSTGIHQSIICSFTKKSANFLQKRLNPQKNFQKLPKQQNAYRKTPKTNSVFQILIQSKSSDVFHNKLKDNIYGQVYSRKYCRLLTIQESITDIFVGIISPPKISRSCPWWSQYLIIFNITQDYSLQPCSPKFLTSANTDSKKKNLFERSEIVERLPEKVFNEVI